MASEIANFSPVKGQLSPTHGTLRLIMPPANSIAFELFSPHLKRMKKCVSDRKKFLNYALSYLYSLRKIFGEIIFLLKHTKKCVFND